MSRRFGLSRRVGLAFAATLATAAVLFVPGALGTTSGAISTTDDPSGGFNACLHGTSVNCNLYVDKTDAFLSGLQNLGDGTYFFALTVPGFAGANDGDVNNLSDAFGDFTTREFTVSSGVVTFTGSGHFVDGNKIQLAPFETTTNGGGVYQLTVCPTVNGLPVTQNCKNDNFKIQSDSNGEPVDDLVVSKTADPSFTRTYSWSIGKAVDKTLVEQIGGTATFNYTVSAAETGFTDSAWQVTGTIEVFNPNSFDVTGVNVTDAIDDGGSCVVTDGTDATVPGLGSLDLSYTCTYLSAPTPDPGTNTATAIWPDIGSPNTTGTGTAPVDFGATTPTTPVNKTITVTDTFNGGIPTTLGTLTATDVLPFASATYTYSHTVNVPANNCVFYTNTAAIVETGQSATKTVEVCGPAKTGALTMGFWQNKNGQGIIGGGAAVSGVCKSGTWLRQFNPFQDLSATATCSTVATYVYNLIKAANAGGSSMNPMLRAQMLATALDVYFSDPALGGNKISAPAPIGGVTIDLTKICKMIDSSGGTATCGGTYENVSSAFGGATSMTVMNMLLFENTVSNVGGTVWYGQVKATQGLAKDAFDAINNQVAFAP